MPFFLAPLVPLLATVLRIFVVRMILVSGLSIVTYGGYLVALSKFKEYVQNSLNNMPADMFALLQIGGFIEGIGYLLGAFTFWVGMKATSKLAFMPKV